MALTSKIFSKVSKSNLFFMKAIGIARVSTKEQEEQ